jgi:hypothetical protein
MATSAPTSNLNITSITDSNNNTWVNAATNGNPQIWYAGNAVTGITIVITLHFSGSTNPTTVGFYDIKGAATSPFDVMAGVGSTNANGIATVSNGPTITPTTINGLVITALQLGQGPGLAVTSPSGAVWDMCTYTSETDMDLMENADGKAHLYNTTTATENWNWNITNNPSNSWSATAVAFKTGSTASAPGAPQNLRVVP